MAKKRLKRTLKTVKEFLTPLKSSPSSDSYHLLGPTLEPYSTQRIRESSSRMAYRGYEDVPIPSDEEADRINRDKIAQANLSQSYAEMAQSKEALNLTLRSQHRLLMATLLTALTALVVAIISSSVALVVASHTKPPIVYVRPNVIINR